MSDRVLARKMAELHKAFCRERVKEARLQDEFYFMRQETSFIPKDQRKLYKKLKAAYGRTDAIKWMKQLLKVP